MHTIHRVYIGARDTAGHKFLPKDENGVHKILKSYLKGWTISKAVGYWEGNSEETIILTVVQTPQNQTGWGNGLEDAVNAIAKFLEQYAIMWESNGTAVVVPTKAVSRPVGKKKKSKPTFTVRRRKKTLATAPSP